VSSALTEVVVVGGGHAGIEAALASARMGCSTILITMDVDAIGRMSCNPAIGGTAKGHLVREIDALGGEMGKIADATGIHFRMLNRSRGPAVWSPRSQNDRDWYSKEARQRVLNQPNLTVVQDVLQDLILNGTNVIGAVTSNGEKIACTSVVLCSGTFLNAVMHTGCSSTTGGRFGEGSSVGLSDRLQHHGFRKGRLKTGTPPRISKNSIDFSATEVQNPDEPPIPFSHNTERVSNAQIPMYLTYTNPNTHQILREGFQDSPMFTGRIKGVGPRYCPSIEDKIDRFADRDRHQIFLEPEGYTTDVVYVNGFSTSLPSKIQIRALRTVPGLERAEFLRAGYAVEYDYFPPHQLEHTLETKAIHGLFFAGQINGTSGYEEAAGQGLIAGINAALLAKKEDPLILQRSNSYIGVMVDDLINKGTDEPYRIFTSRAEYRLKLRQDNADSRLMRIGHSLGLIDSNSIRRLDEKEERVTKAKSYLGSTTVSPSEINNLLVRKGSQCISENSTLEQILKRPEVRLVDLLELEDLRADERLGCLLQDRAALERVQIEVKYDGYLKRQDEQIMQFTRNESITIPSSFDFCAVKSLSSEAREKLQRIRPRSIGQASRISGVTAADMSILMVSVRSKCSTWNNNGK